MRCYILILAAMVMVACRKEAKLTPSEPEAVKLLPQGNHSYDDSIMAAYNKYSTFILYRFTQHDYNYNQIDKKIDSAFNANPAYIGPALRFVYDNLFNALPERLLQKTMPYRILLASYIGGKHTRSAVNFSATYAALTIGWADSTLLQQSTPAQMNVLRKNLIRFYMERAFRAGAISTPADFAALAPADYSNIQTPALKNQYGIIEPTGAYLTLGTDFLGYVEAICTRSMADMESTYFSPGVDVKGNYRLKYNAVINYFQSEFGINLQEVGNAF
ncbi:hypothetical protein [Chitinophaga sp.]|uniref:hypothetical protein n=1 Tax=Chitinophaga sp. TaxID=1869181 RepID=UPI0026351B06|nr:hypothetical protein [uncultured Chitinophaga sp.]